MNLQQLTDRVDGSSRRMGLRINTGKTKTMTIGKQHEDIQIILGEVLEQWFLTFLKEPNPRKNPRPLTEPLKFEQ